MMNVNFRNVTIGKDDKGYYIKMPGVDDIFPIDEIFEEYEGLELDIDIKPPQMLEIENGPYTGPSPQHPEAVDEAKKVIKELDLRTIYSPIRDDLNTFNQIAKYYKENYRRMGYSKVKPKSIEEIKQWQSNLKAKVRELIGLDHDFLQDVPMDMEKGGSTVFSPSHAPPVKMTKFYYTSAPGMKVPAILCQPVEMDDPVPAIIALHGHGPGKIRAVGMTYSNARSYYGLELAQRGFVTLNIDQWGFGERYPVASMEGHPRYGDGEQRYSLTSLWLGLTAIGIRTHDVIKACDYLETLDFVDKEPGFGLVGISGGGKTSTFASVMDDRISAVCIAGYFCTIYSSTFSQSHCACNYVPGLALEADISDVAGIRAPKPTFIQAGDKDGIFPEHGVRKAYEELMEIYKAFGAEDNLKIDFWKGHGHEFTGREVYPWFEKVLKKKGER
ncbi:MAG: alpha/beta hydrolase [Candidatus Hodarchaeota archaeon]